MVLSQLVHAGVVMLGQEIIWDIPVLLVCSLHMTLAADKFFMSLSVHASQAAEAHAFSIPSAGIDCLEHAIMHEDELHQRTKPAGNQMTHSTAAFCQLY